MTQNAGTIKTKYWVKMFITFNIFKNILTETESRSGLQGLGLGGVAVTVTWLRGSWGDRNVLGVDSGDGCTML